MAGKELHSGPTAETVRENIAFFRKDLGLTYADLSRDLERRGHPIPPLGLRRIEAGERRVDVDDLTAVAMALNVNPNALLLPRQRGRRVLLGVTGYAHRHVNAQLAWEWALGRVSLSGLPSESISSPETHARFRARVTPQEILNDEDRADRRAAWLERQKLSVDSQLAELEAADNLSSGETYDFALVQERQDLEALDPSDDEAWSRQSYDPAPPPLVQPKEELDA